MKALLEAKRKHAADRIPWASYRSYLDAIEHQAHVLRDLPAFTFHQDVQPKSALTYPETLEQALRTGSSLLALGAKPGDRIAVLLDTSPEFLKTYLGAMAVGLVPVCLPPSFKHMAAALSDCRVRWVMAEPEQLATGKKLRALAPGVERILSFDQLPTAGESIQRYNATPDDTAILQYTSGSTGSPRAIPVSHRALLGMAKASGETYWFHPGEIAVNWLPFFHDFGLIGYLLVSAAHGVAHHYLSPREFVADPLSWLKIVSQTRASFTGGASFAFRLCIKALAREPQAAHGLDLSRVTRAVIGGERVPAALVRDFCRAFGPFGFDPRALVPGYGLAENVVGVTAKPMGTEPRILRLDATEVVSVGKPFPGVSILIQGDAGPLPDRQVGEIVLDSDYSSPSRTVHTGDLGFLSEGELFVVGRIKDLIIRAGAKIPPEDIEDSCGSVPGIAFGPVAALGIPADSLDTEEIVILAELRSSNGLSAEEIESRVSAAVLRETGHAIRHVYFVEKGEIPRTSSGKLRRGQAKAQLLAGKLKLAKLP